MATYEPEYRHNEVGKIYGYFLKLGRSPIEGIFTDLNHREYLVVEGTSIPVTSLFGKVNENSAKIVVPIIGDEKVPARFYDITPEQAERLSQTRNLPLTDVLALLELNRHDPKTPNRA